MKAATAYNIEGAAVLALAGDYEALNKKLSEARSKELDEVISKAETAIVANEY
jgi:hypothetical protein